MSGLLSDKRRSPGKTGSAPSATGVDQTVTVYEDFEDGDMSEYSGDTGDVTVQSNEVYHGSFALEDTLTTNPDNEQVELISNITGPSQGDSFRWQYYLGDRTSNRAVCLFGVQDADNYFGNRINTLGKRVEFTQVVDGDFSVIDFVEFDRTQTTTGTWTWAEVNWGVSAKGLNSDEARVRYYNANDTKIADLTATIGTTFTSGNVGWFINKWDADPLRIDYLRSPPE